VAIATAWRTEPRRTVLLGLCTWFGVQAANAVGVISGAVGGFAWLALVADPLIAAWFQGVTSRQQTWLPPPVRLRLRNLRSTLDRDPPWLAGYRLSVAGMATGPWPSVVTDAAIGAAIPGSG